MYPEFRTHITIISNIKRFLLSGYIKISSLNYTAGDFFIYASSKPKEKHLTLALSSASGTRSARAEAAHSLNGTLLAVGTISADEIETELRV